MYEGPLRTNVKSVKTSILVLKVIQGHCFRCQSKPVYDFYSWLIVTLALSRTVSEIWRLLGWNPYTEGGTAVQGHPRSSILVLMESL